MALSGIYIVTLNNPHPISVNANDKRMADRAIKVTKDNCKIGKAVDLEKRKKNYFKTFGESNVNFEVLATTLSIDSIEISLLIALDEYRMIGASGRKNEWLENISVDDAKVIISTVFEEYEEHLLDNFLNMDKYIVQKYIEQYSQYKSDEDRQLSALDLIHLFLELKGLTPNFSEWNIDSLQHNTPRLFRLFQLKALFKAFKIDFQPKSFIDGTFIEKSNLDFSKIIEKIIKTTNHNEEIKGKIEKSDLVDTFQILFDYKQKFNNIQNFSSGVYAARGGSLYSYNIVEKSNDSMKNTISEIDSILSNLISPNNDKFTISELVKNYNYPNVDLNDIDIDNW